MLDRVRATLQRVAPSWADPSRPAPIEELRARKALVSKSLVGTLEVGDDAVLTTSGAFSARAGGDIIVNAGGAAVMTAGGDVHINGGGGLLLVSQRSQVESGAIGILLAQHAELHPGVRVLLTTRQALIIGLLAAVGYPLVRYLLQRFAPPPREEILDERALPRFQRWLIGLLIRLAITVAVVFVVYRQVKNRLAPVLRLFGKK
jgi:hypothetical protein